MSDAQIYFVCLTVIICAAIAACRFCRHQWKLLRRVEVWNTVKGVTIGDTPVAYDFEMQCERCGKIKVVRT